MKSKFNWLLLWLAFIIFNVVGILTSILGALFLDENLISKDMDLGNLDNYKGVGFVVKSKDDPSGEKKELSREGEDFRKKLERLLGR